MNLFEDEDARLSEERRGRQVGALGRMDRAPETPDFTAWGKEPRKGSPFSLDNFGGSSPANTTKP